MSKYNLKDIARYAEADMDAMERAEFEYDLMLDTALQQELANYRNIHSSLQMKLSKATEDLSFIQNVKEEAKAHFSGETGIAGFWRYGRWVLAFAAVLIIVLIWSPWREDLYIKYSSTKMAAVTERGEANPDEKMTNAVKAFNRKDFSTAHAIFEEISLEEPGNSRALYYYGVSSLHADEIIAARDAFSKIYQGSSVFKYDAAFYMALSYLKEKNKEKCTEWLGKIPADAANYNKVRDLMRELN